MGSKPKKLYIEDIKKLFPTIEILSTQYIHSNLPLEYRCECSQIALGSYVNLCSGKRHRGCLSKQKTKRKEKYQEVRDYFTSIGYELLSTEYVNKDSRLLFKCSIGHETTITYGHLRRGVRCNTCFRERNRGENHPSYNPMLTEDHRINSRGSWANSVWAIDVKKRDKFTCQICRDSRGGNLVSHHINSYNKFPESRLNLANGITLCENCHKDFHNLFGNGNNTSDQWGIFLYYQYSSKDILSEKEIIEKLAYFISTIPKEASNYHKADIILSFLTRLGWTPPLVYDDETEEFGNYWEPEEEEDESIK